MLIACLSAAFSHNPVTSYTLLALPIAAQEITMGTWLILRGFKSKVIVPNDVPRQSITSTSFPRS
jgi:hypothetical protein